MQEIQLSNLVQSVSPEWLPLLKKDEMSFLIVLEHGLLGLDEADLKEIIEAVIMEKHKKYNYFH